MFSVLFLLEMVLSSMINEAKADFLIIGTRQQLEKTSIESIIIVTPLLNL